WKAGTRTRAKSARDRFDLSLALAPDGLDDHLDRRLSEVVRRAHRSTVGASGSDEQNVPFLRRSQQAIDSQLIAALADRPDDVDDLGRLLIETRQVQDLVMRAVERRANQRVHSRRHADVAHLAL